MRLLLVLALCAAAAAVRAQPDTVFPPPPDSAATAYGSGGGFALLLSEYGFGLGALYRNRLGGGTSLLVETSVSVGKDEREQQFFVGLFGDTVTPFKRNYVLLLPIHLGVEHRLFRRHIEDNFRPFVQLSAGPTFAYQWPYFEDIDDDGVREVGEELNGAFGGIGEGEVRFGTGATLAIGAYFGRSRRAAQGVRFGYTAHWFFEPVDLLETVPEVEDPSRQFFGTPVVGFHFVRLIE
ncbi:MAG: hypothetical protein R3181_14090 [Rubricoccaceae bacterium]|nr:hypothetical protein [Rubricoccaceae bacterium]